MANGTPVPVVLVLPGYLLLLVALLLSAPSDSNRLYIYSLQKLSKQLRY